MKILIDTCDALWFFTDDKQLTGKKKELIENPRNVIFFSAVSAAEIAIKYSIGKLDLPEKPETYLPQLRNQHHFAELPLQESASVLLASLPLIHRDPFDRQLVCQAMAHNLSLLSSDPLIQKYPNIHLL